MQTFNVIKILVRSGRVLLPTARGKQFSGYANEVNLMWGWLM